jgi:hypothetical protein
MIKHMFNFPFIGYVAGNLVIGCREMPADDEGDTK